MQKKDAPPVGIVKVEYIDRCIAQVQHRNFTSNIVQVQSKVMSCKYSTITVQYKYTLRL